MYPEGGDLPPGGGDLQPGFKSRFSYHVEGLIPIILILIIAFFLAARFGVIDSSTPIIGPLASIVPGAEKPASMLIIGNPSRYTMEVLSRNRELVYPITTRTAEAVSRNAVQQLSQYDIVLLDQSQQSNKEVSRALGEGLQKYVNSGGKLITVLDSGIREPNEFGVVGWKTSFANIIPVDCRLETITNEPGCLDDKSIRGRIYPGAFGFNHRIMRGIEQYPAEESRLLLERVLNVTTTGREIAYIEDARTKTQYPAIVETALYSLGKSIYFNYDPGTSPAIFEATLDYLK
ncbi:MAG: hypothetical protein J4478_01970 [Candidatus Diapherotrites archaeon]|uniref:DUF4350 domain-containing protein n=1 Tax=Candidatus Iainarchaeum sp. TaxID=3101447 RepID=A0A7J4JW46_9ARCH|nr:hypothetical protein [Candidatus Diapherotrites archaeon]HIH21704.1 hypothetical protein [Candidatus Diapherotrites archaeon]